MSRRLRKFLSRHFYQLKGAVTSLGWIVQGIEHAHQKFIELDADLKKRAAEISDADERILWTTVGQALTAWAVMEGTLVTMVSILLRTESAKAGLILYSIINFNVWRTIISDLFALDQQLSPFQSRWNKISERLRKIKDIRDRIAHESASKHPVELRVLKPSEFDSRAKQKLFKPLAPDVIQEFSVTVADIAQAAVTLCKEMADALETSAKKSDGPDSNQSPESDAR